MGTTQPEDGSYQKDVLLRFLCPFNVKSKYQCDMHRSVTKRPRCPFYHQHSDLIFNRAIKRHRVNAEQWQRLNITEVARFDGATVDKLVKEKKKIALSPVFCLSNLEGRCMKPTSTRGDGELFCSDGRWHPTVRQLAIISARPNTNDATQLIVNLGGTGTGGGAIAIPPLEYREAPSGVDSPHNQKPSDSVLSAGVISSSSALYGYPSSSPKPDSTPEPDSTPKPDPTLKPDPITKTSLTSSTVSDTLKQDGTLPDEPVSLPSPSRLSRLAAQQQQQNAPGWFEGAIESVQAHPFLTGCSILTVLGAIFLVVGSALGLFGRTR